MLTAESVLDLTVLPIPAQFRGVSQIPPDLVVKSQATDIIEIIVQPIGPPNSVHRAYRYRKSRGELLSTSEVPWSTTKFDGV